MSIRDGPFDIQGGGWDFFEKNSLFPYRSEKNKMSSTKLKINSLFFIQQILIEALFPSELYRFANNTEFNMYKACRPTFGKQCNKCKLSNKNES